MSDRGIHISGAGRAVCHGVDPAGFDRVVHTNGRGRRFDEAPPRARHRHRSLPLLIAHGQSVRLIVHARRRVERRRGAERECGGTLIGNHLDLDRGDRDVGGGCLETKCRRRQVELPADPHQRVALTHEEPIAEIGGRGGIRGAACGSVEAPEQTLGAAIGNLEQQDPVPACRVDGTQYEQVGGEVHAAVRCPSRAIDIDDTSVSRVGRIDRERDGADQLFVRTNGPERLSVSHDDARGDRHARDFGERGPDTRNHEQ